MRLLNKYILLLALGIFLYPSKASAQWPTWDLVATKGRITNIIEQIKQSTLITTTVSTTSKINTAIGDAKNSMSKLASEDIERAKEKAAMVKREKEKYEELKAEVEEHKRVIEEKREEAEAFREDAIKAKEEAMEMSEKAKAGSEYLSGVSEFSPNDIAPSPINDISSASKKYGTAPNALNRGTTASPAVDVQYQESPTNSAAFRSISPAAVSKEALIKAEPISLEEAAEKRTLDGVDVMPIDDNASVAPASPLDRARAIEDTKAVSAAKTQGSFRAPVAVQPNNSPAPTAHPLDALTVAPKAAPATAQTPTLQKAPATVSAPVAIPAEIKTVPAKIDASPVSKSDTGFRQNIQKENTLMKGSSIIRGRSETMAFADILSQEAFVPKGYKNEQFIFSEELSRECQLTVDDLKDPKKMQDCLKKLICCMVSETPSADDCKRVHSKILFDLSTALAAESMKRKNDMASFKTAVGGPLGDSYSLGAKTTRDNMDGNADMGAALINNITENTSGKADDLQLKIFNSFHTFDKRVCD